MTFQPPDLISTRLSLRLPEEKDIPAILRYYTENQERLTPWWPRWPADFFTPNYWRRRILQDKEEFAQGRSVRLLVLPHHDPAAVIGQVSFNQIVQGVAFYCVLGYGLDGAHEGHGYMTEALKVAIRYMFEERNLHRIMANYIPHNQRSGKVLRRLGFNVEGYARDYLHINGEWQDHILTSLTNLNWREE